MSKILFKLTTRERPIRALDTLRSIYYYMADQINFSILVTLDEDDKWIDNHFIDQLKKMPNLVYKFGFEPKNKIEAINRDVNNYPYDWDILVNVSDDQQFILQGFDNIIRDYFKDSTDIVLHLPDTVRDDLMSMSIIGREAYNRDGYIYHNSYDAYYCDNEAMDVAKLRGIYVKGDEIIFVHLHPDNKLGFRDSLYNKYNDKYEKDRLNYESRKQKNFNL